MARISEGSLEIPCLTGIPHGPRTVNALSLFLIGLGTMKSTNTNGVRQMRRLTKDGSEDTNPVWFDPAFAVEIAPFAVGPADKRLTIWGWLKQVD